MKAEIYYTTATGTGVYRYTEPAEMFIISNSDGSIRIYEPQNNTVQTYQDIYTAPQHMLIGYFLNNQTHDLGLKKEGFVLIKTENQPDSHLVSYYKPPQKFESALSEIKLVHRAGKPIYVLYRNEEKIIKKIFFSQYQHISGYSFPTKVTQVNYILSSKSEKDSLIERTIFTDFKINEKTDTSYFDFQIPANAIIKDN
jgi:hypothetical protein